MDFQFKGGFFRMGCFKLGVVMGLETVGFFTSFVTFEEPFMAVRAADACARTELVLIFA